MSSLISFSFLITIANTFLLTIILFTMLKHNRSTQFIISWILVLWILPIIGAILFFLIGILRLRHSIVSQLPEEELATQLNEQLTRQDHFMAKGKVEEGLQRRLISLIEKTCQTPVLHSSHINVYYDGKTLYENMLDDLAKAKNYIFMEYFIWRSDELGEKVKDLLIKKAKEGVSIYLIFDGLGSFGSISHKYKRELKQNNIKYAYFLDLKNPGSRIFLNNRNHRKIVIIDSDIAYTGGMNLGNEYITGGNKFSVWRDTHIKITGEAVYLLRSIFITDWANSNLEKRWFKKKKKIDSDINDTLSLFIPKLAPMSLKDLWLERSPFNTNSTLTQVIFGGPDSNWYTMEQVMLSMFSGAKKSILIQTPYFIPTRTLLMTLINSALSGIRVELMIAGIADKKIPYWAAHTYFDKLLHAGVHIYKYKAGFLHSKTIVVDSYFSSIGTCNLDERSLRLNYELSLLHYSNNLALKLEEQFIIDKKNSISIMKGSNHSPYWLRNSIANLFAPLL